MSGIWGALTLSLFLQASGAQETIDPFAAYAAKDYARALQGFLQLQLTQPQDPRLLMNLGATHYRLGQFDQAEAAFKQAAAVSDPNGRERALYDLGNVAYRQGKMDEAQRHYQAALTLDPNDVDARANLAYVRQEKQQRQQQSDRREKQEKKQQEKEQSGAAPEQDKPGEKKGKGDKGADPNQAKANAPQAAPPKPAPSAGDAPPPSKQSPAERARQQAERTLDGISEERPKKRPPSPNQPRSGKDW